MQSWWDTGSAAFQLLIALVLGWAAVFLVARVVEGRLRRKHVRGSGGALGALGWVWAYSNVIGIPTLVFGAGYLIWTMNWGPGLSAGPTMLIILLMAAAGFLIGFGPGLRR